VGSAPSILLGADAVPFAPGSPRGYDGTEGRRCGLVGREDPPEPGIRDRPYAPGYGIPSDCRGMLRWAGVEECLSSTRNYWVATVRADGRPHVTPVWGLWVNGAFYFGAGPGTRKARNLVENPNVVVHLESANDVVIVEGVAEVVTDPSPHLVERLFAASTAKYGMGSRDVEGSYVVRPRVAFAWSEGRPRTYSRWVFDR
jgi:hypothetical protein